MLFLFVLVLKTDMACPGQALLTLLYWNYLIEKQLLSIK